MREQHDHRVGFERPRRLAAGAAQIAIDNAAVLHVGCQQAERDPRDLVPTDALAVAERRVGGRHQSIALAIERHHSHPAHRLVVNIGEARLHFEIFQHCQNLDRCARPDGKRDGRMPGTERRRQLCHHRQGGRHGRDLDVAGKALFQRADLLLHGARIADNAARPAQHALAFGRKAVEARAALHQQHPEHILELLDAGREGRLGHAASLRSAPEMPLVGERNQIFELVDHPWWGLAAAP